MKTQVGIFIFFLMTSWSLTGQIQTVGGLKYGCVGANFKFFTSTPLASYNWNIGNLSYPIIDSPSQIFPSAGKYYITVGAWRDSIIIYPKPTIGIQSDSPTKGCIPFTAYLKDTTTIPAGYTVTNWKWLYSDGSVSYGNPTTNTFLNKQMQQSYVHLYLTLNPQGCDVDFQFPMYLKMDSMPVVRMTVGPRYICNLPANVNFINNTGESANSNMTYLWTWTLPTSGSSTLRDQTTKTYSNLEGKDTVTLTAYSQMGCQDKDTVVISIVPSILILW